MGLSKCYVMRPETPLVGVNINREIKQVPYISLNYIKTNSIAEFFLRLLVNEWQKVWIVDSDWQCHVTCIELRSPVSSISHVRSSRLEPRTKAGAVPCITHIAIKSVNDNEKLSRKFRPNYFLCCYATVSHCFQLGGVFWWSFGSGVRQVGNGYTKWSVSAVRQTRHAQAATRDGGIRRRPSEVIRPNPHVPSLASALLI
ncbi:unnamed protein product [Colias eurytheme]|nr:unnamed protein product [Colias eurytheme]